MESNPKQDNLNLENQNQSIISTRNQSITSQEVIDQLIINKGEEDINNKSENIRAISKEIIDIINKDKYKKYKINNKNELIKLKIKGMENFSENKTLLEMADLLKIKKIEFENISTADFNELLPENSYMAKKIKKYSIPDEIKNNLKELDKKQFEELEKEEKINLDEIIFKNCEIDINFSSLFPIIKKFELYNCQLPFEIYNKINFNFLTHLILENLGLIDQNFEHLFLQLRANISLRKSLKVFSLKNNNLGVIDLCKGIPNNKISSRAEFKNLEIFDCSENKIFFVSNIIINAIKNIKIFDLTNNNIVFNSGYMKLINSSKKSNFLLLITKNLGLLRENNRMEYIDYLYDIIPKIDYPIQKLSLINLYIGKNYGKMKEINFSKFSKSLIELDLSFGNITDNDLISLIKKNLALYNLKKLNLTRNKLTEKILDLFLENNYPKIFTKLKLLNLSENQINFNKADIYMNFFEKFKSIKLFIVKNTNFELCINNYIKNKIIRHYENEKKKKIETQYTNDDLEIKKIIDNEHYLNTKTNVTINICDINFNKYLSRIKKFYPEILERIDIEIKFNEPR